MGILAKVVGGQEWLSDGVSSFFRGCFVVQVGLEGLGLVGVTAVFYYSVWGGLFIEPVVRHSGVDIHSMSATE